MVQAGGSSRWFTDEIADNSYGRYVIKDGETALAETLDDDLPYGEYGIREVKTNDTYQRTDKAEHVIKLKENGKLYSFDNGHEEILSFRNFVYRSDVKATKIGDSTSERFS